MTSSTSTVRVQVVTGGHPFEAEPFFSVFDSLPDIEWSAATTPCADADVVVFYDMPGLKFTRRDPPVELVPPTREQRAVFRQFAERGTGLVFLHHSIASWPTWDEFADIVGGRFHYQSQELHGTNYPDSGYVFDIEHTVSIVAPNHAVCAGLGEAFVITDELYCFPVFEDNVVPLMRTSFPTHDSGEFFSANHAIRGKMNCRDGWSHPPGSNLVAWAASHGRAPLVYLQFGDGPSTYSNESFRKVLANSIHWSASESAREWARHR